MPVEVLILKQVEQARLDRLMAYYLCPHSKLIMSDRTMATMNNYSYFNCTEYLQSYIRERPHAAPKSFEKQGK